MARVQPLRDLERHEELRAILVLAGVRHGQLAPLPEFHFDVLVLEEMPIDAHVLLTATAEHVQLRENTKNKMINGKHLGADVKHDHGNDFHEFHQISSIKSVGNHQQSSNAP